MLLVPEGALGCGFANEPSGTHTSRTIMVRELRLLLSACTEAAELEDYRSAAVSENALLKRTVSTRRSTFRALRELYGLMPTLPLFHALRELWGDDEASRPLLALLCATSRDPILRASADLIASAAAGDMIAPALLAESIDRAFPGRYLPTVLRVTGRNLASSWKQSGHLAARSGCRTLVESRPAATVYALLLGYLCDLRGDRLFETIWSRLLDAPGYVLREQATEASRRGWLEYRHSGGVTEVEFRHLLRDKG